MHFKLVSCIILVLLVPFRCELFTALVDLERLLLTEGEIVKTLDKYLAVEEQRLAKVRWLQEQFNTLHQQASGDVQTFLSNPVNAYLLVKRLTADWKEAENLVEGLDSKALIQNITHHQDLAFPDDEDLSGAAVALMRLQDTYQLDTSSLARGFIEGTKFTTELTADDCYELGLQAYNTNDYYHTLLWMQEALDRVEDEATPNSKKDMMLEHAAYATYMQGNIRHALKLTEDLLKLVPGHQRAEGNRYFHQKSLAELETQKRGDVGSLSEEEEIPVNYKADMDYSTDKYSRLCRGEQIGKENKRGRLLNAIVPKFQNYSNLLRCRYFTNGNPYLLLQPVQEEELFLNPRVVVYHSILSDEEIETIKYLASPILERATVQSNDKGDVEVASYRISKSAWLTDQVHPTIARISRRFGAITGLTLKTAEELQVVNYGIGGHYLPHFDYSEDHQVNAFKHLGTGNRIATWLNYMSDVTAGGATVFTELEIQVKPEKGSAAFWYNLLQNGDGDTRTRHAACPVLAGSKWVSNKWFHQHGHEFVRQCTLNQYE